MFKKLLCLSSLIILLASCSRTEAPDAPAAGNFDLLIINGSVYDGYGSEPQMADVAITGDRIVAVGKNLGDARQTIDATGLAVAPGFINMLSWATQTLIEDGASQSDIRQGVTLEVMGEGWSMGPLSDAMADRLVSNQGDIRFEVEWRTLGEYLQYLEKRGIATNVASFVGATTVRIHEIGFADRAPTDEELERMRELVRTAMQEGALGVGSSLIYAPAFYARTDELIALNEVAAEFGGRYISHIRNEGHQLLEAVDELIAIARAANIGAEIYHLKAAGEENHGKLDAVFERIEAARADGLDITADMYTYTAGATGLDASMPPWVQEGGYDAWAARLKDPEVREKLQREIATPSDEWENLYLAAGSADRVLLNSFKNPDLKHLTGKTLAEVAAMRGTSPVTTMMDLVVEDGSRVGAIYFLMSEENVKKKIAQPWMAFGSDAESMTPEGVFLLSNPHPRAYGTFARLLGKYVRDEKVISLSEAIRRLTSFPAGNLKIQDRGALKAGYFADVVIFDPATIQDHATFAEPHQNATGVQHVVVNGEVVLADGEMTGARPGRFLKGPGYKPD
ncbi:MAG: D-aminoacylase [Gammaproteobacteria bacterium]|nr:D-aminoacylase [Gammaproteobacteria bacterium]MDH5240731.1 D-aminoacylase [Gammaproteobacteria bacterium]MDH5261711.1 D-aminoacylase [Gammaproteobacteria bacterium]MDH5583618.1 D-aminoacylase [Gammaproteobacteria bacterium]